MFRIASVAPLPRHLADMYQRAGGYPSSDTEVAVDQSSAVVVRELGMGRDLDISFWTFESRDVVIPFTLRETQGDTEGFTISRSTLREFTSTGARNRVEGAPPFKFADAQQQLGCALIAVEGVLVLKARARSRRATESRLWALDRVWRVEDFGYSDEDLRYPPTSANDPAQHVRTRDVSPACVAAIERALARKVAVERGDEDPWSPYHLGPANPAPGGTRRADLADLTLGEALLSKGPITLIDQIGVVPGPHGILPHGVGTPDFRIVSFSGGPASVELGQEVIAFRRDVESLVRSFDMLRNMGRTLDFPNVAAALGVREALTAADIEGVQRELATVDQTKHGQVSRANVALGFAAALLGAAPLGWIALGLVLDGKSLANPYGIVVLSGLLAHHPGSLDVWHEHLQGVVRVSGDARDPATRACITSIIESLGRDPM